MQSPAEVYTLAVSPVALPGPPHLQPPVRITGQAQDTFAATNVTQKCQLKPGLSSSAWVNNGIIVVGFTEGSTGFQVARHSLSYIQEIGNGWFGQVRRVLLMYKFWIDLGLKLEGDYLCIYTLDIFFESVITKMHKSSSLYVFSNSTWFFH